MNSHTCLLGSREEWSRSQALETDGWGLYLGPAIHSLCDLGQLI